MEKKIEFNKGRFVFLIIIPFLIGLSIFYMRNKNNLSKAIEGLSMRNKSLELSASFPYRYNLDRVHIYKDRIVNLEGANLIVIDKNGKQVSSKATGYYQPFIEVSSYIYIGDSYNGDVSLYDQDANLVDESKVDKEIISFREIEKSLVYHLKNEDSENLVVVKNGDIVHYENFDGVVLDYDIKEDQLIVSNLNMENGQVFSKIDLIGEEKYALGLDMEIAIKIKLIGEEDFILVSDKSIKRYKEASLIFDQPYTGEIRDLEIDNENIYLLIDKNLSVYDFNGNLENSYHLDDYYEDIYLDHEGAYLTSKNKLILFKKGEVYLDLELENDKLIVDKNKVYRFNQGELEIYILINE